MPIKLKTTPHLTRAARTVKLFLVITAIIAFAVLVVGWSVAYLRGYLKNPTLYNPLAITLDNMATTGRILPPVMGCASILLVVALCQFIMHLNTVSKLRHVKSRGYQSGRLTQSQLSTLDGIAVEYIRELLGIKSETAKNVWRNLRPQVTKTLEQTEKNAHIDLNAVIKNAIAETVGDAYRI